ncbi:MAG TPA: hypothetical protein VKV95_03065 [Terriglobia bacterium]|nr:hypothetical protein [Terriglobia bacterium]
MREENLLTKESHGPAFYPILKKAASTEPITDSLEACPTWWATRAPDYSTGFQNSFTTKSPQKKGVSQTNAAPGRNGGKRKCAASSGHLKLGKPAYRA